VPIEGATYVMMRHGVRLDRRTARRSACGRDAVVLTRARRPLSVVARYVMRPPRDRFVHGLSFLQTFDTAGRNVEHASHRRAAP
jgi:hypothetical protein